MITSVHTTFCRSVKQFYTVWCDLKFVLFFSLHERNLKKHIESTNEPNQGNWRPLRKGNKWTMADFEVMLWNHGVITVDKMSVFKTVIGPVWHEMRLIAAKSIMVIVSAARRWHHHMISNCHIVQGRVLMTYWSTHKNTHTAKHIKPSKQTSHTQFKSEKHFHLAVKGAGDFSSYWAEGLRDPQMAWWTAGHSHGTNWDTCFITHLIARLSQT